MQRLLLTLIFTQVVGLAGSSVAASVYFNDFSGPNSIQDFTIIGEHFAQYNPPPLHNVSVQSGQLQITTSALLPNGPGTSPVLLGSAMLMGSTAGFGSGYANILSQNSGVVSWAFNVANQDGAYNNGFDFILGSTIADPYSTSAHGYILRGGGMIGSQMMLTRFNFGIGGGADIIMNISSGLDVLPSMGSFMVTFNPSTAEWRLYGAIGNAFQDPTLVTTLLGSGVDAGYVNQALPYFGLGGNTTGLDIFDNVSVTVPEPSAISLIVSASVLTLSVLRGKVRRQKTV